MDPTGSLPDVFFSPHHHQHSGIHNKRSLSGRPTTSRTNPSIDPWESQSNIDSAPAGRASIMQAIPRDVFEHIDALKNYEDGMILHWLALLRGTARHLRTPTDYSPFANQRMSNVSSNSRSSNASSLFSPRQPRNSTASWGTKYSHDSTLGTPTREPSEMPFVDGASPMEITHDFPGFTYDAAPTQMHNSFVESNQRAMNTSSVTDVVGMYDRQQSIMSMQQPEDLNATLRRPVKPARTGREKSYFCTACDQDFARKWDWKHHEEEFHERSRKWVCPDCNRPDFFAENSFKKHHERSHQCKKCPHARKAMVLQEQRIAWGCGICKALLKSWDERMEHVAVHYEEGKTKKDWIHSKVVYGLLHQDDIIARWRTYVALRHGRDGVSFSWDKKIIKDGLRGLEYERDPADVEEMVKKAYEFGICQPQQRRSSQNKPLPSLPGNNEKVEQVLASPSSESPPARIDVAHLQDQVKQSIHSQAQSQPSSSYFEKMDQHDSAVMMDHLGTMSPGHNFVQPTPFGQQTQSFQFVSEHPTSSYFMSGPGAHGQPDHTSWMM